MNKTEKTPQDLHKEELTYSQAATSKWRKRAVKIDEELEQEKELTKKYIDIISKVTKLLIGSNPFKLTCPFCNVSTYVYLVTKQGHIQEVAGCFCPYCGERVMFVKKEK